MHNFVSVADCRILLETLPYFLTADANHSEMKYVNVVVFYVQSEMVLWLVVYCLFVLFVCVSGRTGRISVRMAKIALMALSTATLEEKYDCEYVLPTAHRHIHTYRLMDCSATINSVLLTPIV